MNFLSCVLSSLSLKYFMYKSKILSFVIIEWFGKNYCETTEFNGLKVKIVFNKIVFILN